MRAFILYLALGSAGAGSQAPAAAPSQPYRQQPARVRLTPAEISELKSRAEKGEPSAQLSLGEAYEAGNGVSQNDDLAFSWYRKSAERGNAVAQDSVGVLYCLGQGVSKDKQEAVRWFHKAAKQGNPEAMFNLGASYYNGDGVPSNPTLAYAWFLLAEEAGNAMAPEAVKRSAEENGRMGTPDALQQVALMYAKGDDLPQSYSEAAKWYRRAADLSPQAAVRLASMLINGQGVARDYDQAMGLCKGAAKSNYPPALFCIGFLYRKGLGTAPDPKEAFKWYTEASRVGQHQATMDLAEMYWKGEGTSVNRSEAYYLFFLASRRGDRNAKMQAEKLWAEMSHDDIKNLENKLRGLRIDPQKVISYMHDPQAPDPLR